MSNIMTLKNDWDNQTISILEKIRQNCVLLSDKHKNKFYLYKSYSNYFDMPILVLSSLSSPLSVGAQPYLGQDMISVIVCGVGIIIAIITSIKLYLNVADTIERENKVSREFYILAVDIFKTISLPQEKRGSDCISYFNSKYSEYIKLLESSTLLKKRFKQDQLVCLPDGLYFSDESSKSSGDDISLEEPQHRKLTEMIEIITEEENEKPESIML